MISWLGANPDWQTFKLSFCRTKIRTLPTLIRDEFEDRREQYDRGDFSFVGVRVEADVIIDGHVQVLTSPGLWGIESDSGDEYLREVADEEWQQLRDTLEQIGVPSSQLADAERGRIKLTYR